MTEATNSIADAIVQAQAAAAQLANSQAPAVAGTTGTAVGAPVTPGAPLSLDDMMAGGVAVDHWLKITSDGLKIGDKTKPLDTIEVFVDMSEIAYNFSIKYSLNNVATYHKTYDRITDAQGGSWPATIQKAQAIDPKAYEYRSAEIPFVSAADIQGKDGSIAAKEGDRLGLALSTTGWKNFQTLVQNLAKSKIDPKTAVLKLKLGYESKSKPGVQPWGVATFLDIEEVDVMPVLGSVH